MKVADWAVGDGDAVIATIGLGSCVAIILHDAQSRVGGLAHILLPNEGMSRELDNRAKFPGSAVPLLLEEMVKLGSRGRITARIAGGASMFGALLPSGGINMGERNIAATRDALIAAKIPIAAEDVGGDYGRSIFFTVQSGHVHVRSLKRGDREL